jgi:hypothetical protein
MCANIGKSNIAHLKTCVLSWLRNIDNISRNGNDLFRFGMCVLRVRVEVYNSISIVEVYNQDAYKNKVVTIIGEVY